MPQGSVPELLTLPMGREHLEAVAELERLCFREPWSARALELLLGEDATGAVSIADGRVVAYGGMMFAPGEGQITNVAVHPDFRRRGCAGAVLRALTLVALKREDCQQISLEVRESNGAAIALYQQNGFLTVGRRRRFYRNPAEDGLVMIKNLGEDAPDPVP
ncbi:MAG: ribosomal protein S18-alanine N-acetyltransferase [Clostridia bacterium]|nr:ribosomal protein S18-alanine N-acetyltransferase [Clostridia bacterium]